MSNKTLGIVGIVLGAVMVVSNVLVGIFGWWWLYQLVGFPFPGFGWRKITLIVLGVLFIILGFIFFKVGKKAST